ncbi:MAG TPA: folate-binding protein [Alphaproteobacteria bacterium]|nr:folate-binding protein [Alphaproteobacteria bacterium]
MAEQYVALTGRGVVGIAGPDRAAFLQGLVSNDVAAAGPDRAVYAALLTPQGKFLHDMLVWEDGERLLLDVESERRADLLKRLRLYKLRSRIELLDLDDRYAVYALPGVPPALLGLGSDPGAAKPLGGGLVAVDPRLAALGLRAVLPRDGGLTALEDAGLEPGPFTRWDLQRLRLGVPDGSRDLVVEKAILLENNLDALRAVAWDKGCYMGQELTARTRYRGLIRKRLLPVRVEGALPPPGTPVTRAGAEVGEVRSGDADRALALLRLDALGREGALEAAGARLHPEPPDWLPAEALNPPAG